MIFRRAWFYRLLCDTPHASSKPDSSPVCFYSLLLSLLQPRPRDLMHHLRLIQFTASQVTGSYQPDRGIFRHLETRTVCPIPSSLICPLLPSGIYACFFYFSNHWAPASLKLIESETCLPEETLTLSIKEISDFILSIRSKDWAQWVQYWYICAHNLKL